MTPSERLEGIALRLAQEGHVSMAAEVSGLAADVRRTERALDEIVQDAAEDERALAALARDVARIPRLHQRPRRARWRIITGGRVE